MKLYINYLIIVVFAALVHNGATEMAADKLCTACHANSAFRVNNNTFCRISQQTSDRQQAISDLYRHVSSQPMYVDNCGNTLGKKMIAVLYGHPKSYPPKANEKTKASLPINRALNVHDEAYFVFGLRKIIV
jgi:hypothetical protein